VPTVRVQDNEILTDPDSPTSRHYCDPVPVAQSVSSQTVSSMKAKVKAGKRPRAAYVESVAEVICSFISLFA
jgi:hypothetical protein